jgi:hypothetical protein
LTGKNSDRSLSEQRPRRAVTAGLKGLESTVADIDGLLAREELYETKACQASKCCCPDRRAAYAISPHTTSYTSRRRPKLLVHHPRRLLTQDGHLPRIFPSFIDESLK